MDLPAGLNAYSTRHRRWGGRPLAARGSDASHTRGRRPPFVAASVEWT